MEAAVRPPAFTLADGNTVYAVLGVRPAGWDALPADELTPTQFDAFPDEIPGWQQLSKNAIKRGLGDLRWEKLRAERSRRKLAASAARTAASDGGAAAAESSKRARPADLERGADGSHPPSKRRRGDGADSSKSTVALGAKLRHWAATAASGVRIVIDCNFTKYMHSGELASMFAQLRLSYAAVRSHGVHRPLRLILTSVTSEWVEGLDHIGDGTWRSWPIDAYEQHFMEVFGPAGPGAAPAAAATALAATGGTGAASAGATSADATAGLASWPVMLSDVRRVRAPSDRTLALMRARDAPTIAVTRGAGAASGGVDAASCGPLSATVLSTTAIAAVDGASATATSSAASGSSAGAVPAPPAVNVYALPTPLTSSGASKLVYLTPDTDVTLRALDPECVYIVGGFVDKGRNKMLTASIAKQHGIATAKLPLDEHIDVKHAAVLTTNHVLTILARVAETGDWHSAIVETVPMRKGYVPKTQASSTGAAAATSSASAASADDEVDEGSAADATAAESLASP